MSANPLPKANNVYHYDFTAADSNTFGGSSSVKEITPGIWGMIAGDGNADGVVNSLDKVNVWESKAGESGYKGADLNLDGQSNNLDKDATWLPNFGYSSQVPQ